MKFAKKASTLLDGIRRSRRTRKHRVVEESAIVEDGVPIGVPAVTLQPSVRASQRIASREGASTAKRGRRRMGHTAVYIHEDGDVDFDATRSRKKRAMEAEDRGHHVAVQEIQNDVPSDATSEEEDEDEDIDESVADDMRHLEESFQGISHKYRLINRIGEGTFSTVYKAEMLPDPTEDEENEYPDTETDPELEVPPTKRRKVTTSSSQATLVNNKRKPQYVALKKIYVTSSPSRIANELELLHILRDSPHICPLLTAFRHLDQVVAVLPYFRHLDFRLYYRQFLVSDMRYYFESLLNALQSVHEAGILHRDIKPTNFLYDTTKRQGVLVDFGLAEKEETDWQPCLCNEAPETRKQRYLASFGYHTQQMHPEGQSTGYPKIESRASKRANRAGTRGFRAPEVLFKCTSQTTKIDIWSAGVILLSLLAQRFPFFNSSDDIDALIELSSIFGKTRMRACAATHGSIYETNIETVGANGFALDRIIIWATNRNKENDTLNAGEAQAVRFMTGLLELDPHKRLTAEKALQHEFFRKPVEDEEERLLRMEDQRLHEGQHRDGK